MNGRPTAYIEATMESARRELSSAGFPPGFVEGYEAQLYWGKEARCTYATPHQRLQDEDGYWWNVDLHRVFQPDPVQENLLFLIAAGNALLEHHNALTVSEVALREEWARLDERREFLPFRLASEKRKVRAEAARDKRLELEANVRDERNRELARYGLGLLSSGKRPHELAGVVAQWAVRQNTIRNLEGPAAFPTTSKQVRSILRERGLLEKRRKR